MSDGQMQEDLEDRSKDCRKALGFSDARQDGRVADVRRKGLLARQALTLAVRLDLAIILTAGES
jgi:hypothetical protein